jgi:FdrA protein
MSLETVFGQSLRVINLGLDLFALELHAAGVQVVHVDWRPPAGADPHLAALLERLDEDADA